MHRQSGGVGHRHQPPLLWCQRHPASSRTTPHQHLEGRRQSAQPWPARWRPRVPPAPALRQSDDGGGGDEQEQDQHVAHETGPGSLPAGHHESDVHLREPACRCRLPPHGGVDTHALGVRPGLHARWTQSVGSGRWQWSEELAVRHRS